MTSINYSSVLHFSCPAAAFRAAILAAYRTCMTVDQRPAIGRIIKAQTWRAILAGPKAIQPASDLQPTRRPPEMLAAFILQTNRRTRPPVVTVFLCPYVSVPSQRLVPIRKRGSYYQHGLA